MEHLSELRSSPESESPLPPFGFGDPARIPPARPPCATFSRAVWYGTSSLPKPVMIRVAQLGDMKSGSRSLPYLGKTLAAASSRTRELVLRSKASDDEAAVAAAVEEEEEEEEEEDEDGAEEDDAEEDDDEEEEDSEEDAGTGAGTGASGSFGIEPTDFIVERATRKLPLACMSVPRANSWKLSGRFSALSVRR